MALILTLLSMAVLSWVGRPLTTSAAPNGIVSYEFAGSVAKANEILNSWGEAGRLHAAFSLGLDYFYIVWYVLSIGLSCRWAGETLGRRGLPLSGLGIPLLWGICLAGALDGIENLALTRMLLIEVSSPWPQLAEACAAGKFLLIALGLLFALYGGLAWLTGLKRTK
jgi:hypothetical protein